MRSTALLLVTVAALLQSPLASTAQEPAADAAEAVPEGPVPPLRPVGNMSELMLKAVYPLSDHLFYVEREAPKDEYEWLQLETRMFTLAEIGNLLRSPMRAYDDDQWMRDAQLLVDVASKAYKSALARDVQSMIDLNAELYESCQSCHVHYRPGYRRRL